MTQLIQKYEGVLQQEPNNLEALHGLAQAYSDQGQISQLEQLFTRLEGIYEQAGSWPELVGVLHRHEALIDNPKDKSDLLCRLGEVYHKRLRHKYEAIDAYVKALELDYQKTHLLDVLGEIYAEKQESFKDIIDHLEHEALNTNPQQRLANWLEIADIYSKVISHPEKAFEYYERALGEDPNNAFALEAIEKTHIQRGDWQKLIALYEEMIGRLFSGGGAGNEGELVSFYFKKATVFKDKLGMPLEAMEAYEQIVTLAPNNLQVRAFMEELRGQKELWQSMAQDLLDKGRKSRTTPNKTTCLKKAAKILLYYLGEKEAATAIYLELLENEPEDLSTLELVQNLYRETGDWQGLIELHEKMLRQGESSVFRTRILNQIGGLYKTHLRLPQLAINAYERALKETPDDPNALQSLEVLYWENKDWFALVPILEKLLEKAQSQDHRLALATRLAGICMKYLGERTKAVRHFREILNIDPNHVESLMALEQIYQESRDWEGLSFVYSKLLNVAQDQSRLFDTLKKYAALLFDRFDQPDKAVQMLKRAQELNPQDLSLTMDLERMYLAHKNWDDLVALYDHEGRKARTPNMSSLWFRKAGELYERQLNDNVKALECYQQAFQYEPHDLKTIRSLENVLERTQNWDGLVALCKIELQTHPAPGLETIPLLLRIAETQEHRQRKYGEAITVYQQILSIDEHNLSALKALERLYLRMEDWSHVLAIYQKQALAASHAPAEQFEQTNAALVQLYRRISQIYLEKLPSPTEAAAINEKILELKPGDHEAIQNLKVLYQDREKWIELVSTLEREVAATPDPHKSSGLFKEISTIFLEKLADPARGLNYLEKAYELHSEELSVINALALAYERAGRWDDLIALYRRELKKSVAQAQKISLMERIGLIYKNHLQKPEASAEMLRAVLELDPKHKGSLEMLQSLYTQLGKWNELIEMYLTGAKHTQNAQEIGLLYSNVGEVYENRLAQEVEAMTYYRLAIDNQPQNLKAVEAMRRNLKRVSNTAEYLRYTRMACDLLQDRELKASYLIEMGQTWKDAFRQNRKAIQCFKEAINLKPAHTTALRELWRLFLEETQWAEAIEVGQKLLHVSDTSQEQAEIRLLLGQIHARHLKDLNKAASYYQEALTLDPGNLAVIKDFREVQVQRGRWHSVIDLTYQQIELTPDPAEKLPLLHDIAVCWRDQLGSTSNAKATMRQILGLNALDENALQALGTLIADPTEWQEIQNLVFVALENISARDASAKHGAVASLLILATIWEDKLSSPQMALTCLERAKALDATHMEVFASIRGIIEKIQDWPAFLNHADEEIVLLNKNKSGDPAVLQDVLLSCARVCSEHLGDVPKAITYAEQAYKKFPKEPNVLLQMEFLLISAKRWKELLQNYEAQLEISDDRQQRSELFLKLGDLLYEPLNDAKEARKYYEKALKVNDRSVKALEQLGRIYKQSEEWEGFLLNQKQLASVLGLVPKAVEVNIEISKVSLEKLNDVGNAEQAALHALELDSRNLQAIHLLQEIYLKAESWENLLKMYQREATLHLTEEREVELYQAMAELWRERFHEMEKAGHCLRRAVQINPKDQKLWQKTYDFFEGHKAWTDLLDIIKYRMNHGEPGEADLLQLHHGVANLLADRLDEPDGAIEHFEAVLKAPPNPQFLALINDAIDRLVELYRKRNRTDSLLNVLERKSSLAESSEETLGILLQIAEIWENNLGLAQNAEDTYHRMLNIDARNNTALERLKSIYKTASRWDAYSQILEKLLPTAKGPADKLALHLELSTLYRERLKDPERAIQHLEAVMTLASAEAPERLETSILLETLYQESGKWEAYLVFLEQKFSTTKTPLERYQIAARQGDIHLNQLRQSTRAIECYERALEQKSSGDGLPLLRTLRQLYRDSQAWSSLISVLNRMIESKSPALDKIEQIDVLLDRADIEEIRLENFSGAAESLRRLLELVPGHKKAMERLVTLLRKIDSESTVQERLGVTTKLLDLENDPKRKAQLHFEISQFHDDYSKEQNFHLKKSLGLDKTHRGSLCKLRELALSKKNWAEAAKLLQLEVEVTESADDLQSMFFQLGEIHLQHLKNTPAAVEAFERALHYAPQNRRALSALARIHYDAQVWKSAEPYYVQLSLTAMGSSSSPPGGEDEELTGAEISYRLGKISYHLSRPEEAIARFQQALQIEPEHASSLRDLAELYYSLKQWKNAAPVLQDILALKGGAAKTLKDTLPTVHYRLGMVHLNLFKGVHAQKERGNAHHDDLKQARRHLTDALKADAWRLQALQALVEVDLLSESYESALEHLDQLIAASTDSEGILEAYTRKAEILSLHQERDEEAVKTFQAALDRDPSHEPALQGLARIYQKRKEWPEALQALKRIRELLLDNDRIADILYQEAVIYGRHIGDQTLALEHLEKTLELVPDHRASLDEMAHIHRSRQHWEKLLQHLQYCLKILPASEKDGAAKIQVEIGELLLSQLGSSKEAENVFQDILAKSPGDQKAKLALASIHANSERSMDLAVREFRELLRDDVTHVEALRRLTDLLRRHRLTDALFTSLSLLAFYERKPSEELQKLSRHARQLLEREPQKVLEAGDLEEILLHPNERGDLRAILAMLKEPMHKFFTLEPKLNRASPSIQTDIAWKTSAKRLGLGEIKIEMFESVETYPHLILPLASKTIYVHPNFDHLGHEGVQRFIAGTTLYYLMCGLLPAFYFDDRQIKIFFAALINQIHPTFTDGKAVNEEYEHYSRQLKKILSRGLRKDLRDPLTRVMTQFDRVDFTQFLRATRHSAHRLGLLLCQEPQAALYAIALHPTLQRTAETKLQDLERLTEKERSDWMKTHPEARELMRFALSDNYESLRARLGISLPEYV